MSPYTAKQKRLIHARAHGWRPTKKGVGMTEEAAKRMEAEMEGQPTKRAVKRHKGK